MTAEPVPLEIRGVTAGLLDDPLALSVRGAGNEGVLWRARYRDDDFRVWRASAARPEDLTVAWRPSKPSTGPIASLQSLRPVRIDVRVESPDGRAAGRAITRRLVADGVRVRRWRDGLLATLYLPAGTPPRATVLVDSTAGPLEAAVAGLAAPLLASRGVLVLAVGPGRGEAAEAVAIARERLVAVPGASAPVELAATAGAAPAGAAPGMPDAPGSLALPPGVGAREEGEDDGAAARARAAAWDALLARLGARARGPA
jgi:hypothetical protein